MKAVALTLLFLMPISAQAQDQPAPQHAKAKKLKWIGIGMMGGGVGAAVAGVLSGKQTAFSGTFIPGGTCTSVQAGSSTGASASTTTCTVLTGISIPTMTPTTTSITVTRVQRRVANWKITGPAIAGAGAGALLITIGHFHAKTAELSIRPDGAVRVAFRW